MTLGNTPGTNPPPPQPPPPPPLPLPTQSNGQEHRTHEQIHYNNISSFLKWGVGIAGTLIAAIATVAIIVSYNDRNAMKEEYSNAIKDFKDQIKELKDEAKETAATIKNDSKDAVKNTQDYAENEISKISTSTNTIALQETQKQINDLFRTDKIQSLIETKAVQEIESKVEGIVGAKTKNIIKINDAASRMRIGHVEGMYLLRRFFTHPDNSMDSLRAKNLYDAICADYNWKVTDFKPIDVSNNKMPSDSTQRKSLRNLVERITDKYENLSIISMYISELSQSTGIIFKPFQIEEISKWYNNLKK